MDCQNKLFRTMDRSSLQQNLKVLSKLTASHILNPLLTTQQQMVLAERMVRTFKQSLKAMKDKPISLNKKIANFLLMYRNAPHATTNELPAKMFLANEPPTNAPGFDSTGC